MPERPLPDNPLPELPDVPEVEAPREEGLPAVGEAPAASMPSAPPPREVPPTVSAASAASAVSAEESLTVRAARVDASADAIAAALEVGRGCLEEYQIARAADDLARVRERMRLGMGLTVAALAGGTGSGKSTLFNALTGLDFADAGDIRPTTSQTSACTWNADSGALLDFLEVAPSRRILHDSPLVDPDHTFDGLVLLDLPDHDSVNIAHAALVDSLLPRVDILLWVLDPQKYADHIIHDLYLSQMVRRAEHMVVLVNQMDTIPANRMEELLGDVRAKLASDGLPDVPVLAVSALEGSGLDAVRDALRAAIAREEASISTAEAELDAIRRRLADGVGHEEVHIDAELLAATAQDIGRAAGVPAVVDSLRHAGTSLRPTAIARPEKPSTALAAATRDAWMSTVNAGLPEKWKRELDTAVPSADELRREVGAALQGVRVPLVATAAPRQLEVVGILLALVGFIQLFVAWPFTSLPVRLGLAALGVVLAIVLRPLGIRMQQAASARASTRFERRARRALEEVTERMLAAPSAAVLERHRAVREEFAAELG